MGMTGMIRYRIEHTDEKGLHLIAWESRLYGKPDEKHFTQYCLDHNLSNGKLIEQKTKQVVFEFILNQERNLNGEH